MQVCSSFIAQSLLRTDTRRLWAVQEIPTELIQACCEGHMIIIGNTAFRENITSTIQYLRQFCFLLVLQGSHNMDSSAPS